MKTETILAAFPLLYRNAPDLCPSRARSSYAMKHDLEHLYDEYCSNEDLKSALRETIRFHSREQWNDTDLYFYVKPRFDLFWLRENPTTRPRGARKVHWEAYLAARAWATQHPATPDAPAIPVAPTATG